MKLYIIFVVLSFAIIAMFGSQISSQNESLTVNKTNTLGNMTDDLLDRPTYHILSENIRISPEDYKDREIYCPEDAPSRYEYVPLGGGYEVYSTNQSTVHAVEDMPIISSDKKGWRVNLYNADPINEARAMVHVACYPVHVNHP